jgi:hypothetical protein
MDAIEQMDQIGRSAMAAWNRIKKAQTRMWADWMVVGEGLMEGRRWAQHKAGVNKPEGKGYVVAYSEWLAKYRLADMDKSDRAKLLQLMDERPAVEEWRAGLTDWERRNLNNPVIAWRKWTAATRVKKPKPRTASVSGAEHGRAKGIIEELQARNAELEEELAAARATGHAESTQGARIQELEKELAAKHQTAEPDRDREIAQLKTRITELEATADEQPPSAARITELETELAHQRDEREKFGQEYWKIREYLELRTEGIFTRAEFNKVRGLLHPDRGRNAEEQKRLTEAFNIFSRCEKLLKKEPLPKPPPMPTTLEELMEARLRVKAENRARGLRAAAARKRKKPERQLADGG